MASTIRLRPELEVVGLLVALQPVELRLLRRHQQLEHETASLCACEVVGQPLQPRGLALVQRAVAFGVVAHQDLAEGRIEGLDVAGEILAVLEIELVLPALLGRAGRDDSPAAAASRRMAAPNCSSTRMPAFSFGTPPATAALKPS